MKLYHPKKQTINRILLQILLWFVSLILFAYIFKISDTVGKIDILFSFLFHLSIFIGVYINLFLLMPNFLNKKRYILYILFLIILISGITFLNQLTFFHFADILLPEYYFVSQFNYLETGILVLAYIIGTTILSLSKSWFKLQEVNARIIKIEKENISNQLEALKSQINPHFLFNSLNVIYSLALKQSKDTSDTIIKLSDILRYVIYDSNKEKVSIKSEIKLINNYISLQKHRIDSSTKIAFNMNIQNEIQIPPMLLLPLVENSFKHGVKGDLLNTYVNINLLVSKEKLHFEIENNKGVSNNPTNIFNGGIGLKNIKQRLNLLYPNKHEFIISEDGNIFKVLLKLNYEN